MTILTNDEIEAKRAAIETRLGVKVYTLVVSKRGEQPEIVDEKSTGKTIEAVIDQAVGFLKEPSRQAKFAAMETLMDSKTDAAEMLLKSAIILEESDARITSQDSKDDTIYISGAMQCLKLLEVYSAELKKK